MTHTALLMTRSCVWQDSHCVQDATLGILGSLIGLFWWNIGLFWLTNWARLTRYLQDGGRERPVAYVTISSGGVAVCFSVLQCVVVCCSVLQCVAMCCSLLQSVAVCCSVLQCVAVCCSVSQCVAVCCSMLQCVGRQHVAQTCCTILPHRGCCIEEKGGLFHKSYFIYRPIYTYI